jgi:hypothetical protein
VCVCERERESSCGGLGQQCRNISMKCCCVLCNHFGLASSGSARLYIYTYSTHFESAYHSIRQHTSAYVSIRMLLCNHFVRSSSEGDK